MYKQVYACWDITKVVKKPMHWRRYLTMGKVTALYILYYGSVTQIVRSYCGLTPVLRYYRWFTLGERV